ncbi:MAG: glycoside hydrolase family 30 beta sandwich domain-containing protein [Paludibacter sp.]|nr:glycoside hydrolase family 30 beta sandwich domain-containing protein [Paludibacter sp.]
MRITYYLLLALYFTTTSFTGCKTDEKPQIVTSPTKGDVEVFVTTANKSMLFTSIPLKFSTKPNMNIETTITMNAAVRFQDIDGFGAAISGSSAYNLLKMTQANRTKLLKETFDPVSGMGYSYIRISIGCSDFSLDEFTYCDKPGIENFALHELDKRDLFPILREILAINPTVKIMASPWTPPRWMKVNNLTELKPYNSWTGGQLNPAYYQDYAIYFVKYIQEMKKEGFDIESITIQNEPLHKGNSASLYMTWQEQATFIKNALGPKFATAGLKTKIIVYDHNFNYDNIQDQISYPVKLYADPEAAKYVDGAAFHAYGGDKSEMLNVRNAFPNKNLYFTEMSIGSWNYTFDGDLMWFMRELGIGTLNNYNKAVIVWNFMLDEKGEPNRPGGCTTCYGAVDISTKDYATLDRKSHFYLIGHLSKAISPAAVRIGTSGFQASGLYYTAVENTDGTYGVVMQNDTDKSMKITLADALHSFPFTIPAKSVVSYRWKK